MQTWKTVKGYTNYQINENGDLLNKKGRLLKRVRNKKTGYEFYILTNNKLQKLHYIHRLVAQAFIPNPKKRKTVNHKDFNKSNNNVSNLEWLTLKENIQYSKNHDPNFSKKKSKYKMIYQVIEKTFDGKFVAHYNNVYEASEKHNVHSVTIGHKIHLTFKHCVIHLDDNNFKVYNPDGSVLCESISRSNLLNLGFDPSYYNQRRFFNNRFYYGDKIKQLKQNPVK